MGHEPAQLLTDCTRLIARLEQAANIKLRSTPAKFGSAVRAITEDYAIRVALDENHTAKQLTTYVNRLSLTARKLELLLQHPIIRSARLSRAIEVAAAIRRPESGKRRPNSAAVSDLQGEVAHFLSCLTLLVNDKTGEKYGLNLADASFREQEGYESPSAWFVCRAAADLYLEHFRTRKLPLQINPDSPLTRFIVELSSQLKVRSVWTDEHFQSPGVIDIWNRKAQQIQNRRSGR